MPQIFLKILLFFMLSYTYYCTKTSGKLNQADSNTSRMGVMQRVGQSFLQLGVAQSSQSSKSGTVLVVSIIALVTVVIMCLASQCIVHHAKSCQKELNRYHQQQMDNQEFTQQQSVFIFNDKKQKK